MFTATVWGRYYYCPLTDEETDAQRGEVTCCISHSQYMEELDAGPGAVPQSALSPAMRHTASRSRRRWSRSLGDRKGPAMSISGEKCTLRVGNETSTVLWNQSGSSGHSEKLWDLFPLCGVISHSKATFPAKAS